MTNHRNLGSSIKKLRKEGKTYTEIAEELDCTISIVAYYISPGAKNQARIRSNNHRKNKLARIKKLHGGRCKNCGYSKCKRALHFHHINPSLKDFNMAEQWLYSEARVIQEANKCIMLCSNCHAELHDNLITIEEILTKPIVNV